MVTADPDTAALGDRAIGVKDVVGSAAANVDDERAALLRVSIEDHLS